MLLAAEDGITAAGSATAATGPWRSRCRPASPTTPGRTGSSPRWPPPPAPAAASRRWNAGGASGAAPPPGASHARPDGYGRWSEQAPGQPAAATDFFLEYDTGTEPLTRVVAKLAGYAALAARTGITTPVLFWLRSPSREAALHARLQARRRPASATPPRPRRSPASRSRPPPAAPAPAARPGRPGCPPGSPGPRLRLAQLAPPGTVPLAAARTARHRRPARRPGLAPAGARPARLERPARRAPPRPGRR